MVHNKFFAYGWYECESKHVGVGDVHRYNVVTYIGLIHTCCVRTPCVCWSTRPRWYDTTCNEPPNRKQYIFINCFIRDCTARSNFFLNFNAFSPVFFFLLTCNWELTVLLIYFWEMDINAATGHVQVHGHKKNVKYKFSVRTRQVDDTENQHFG